MSLRSLFASFASPRAPRKRPVGSGSQPPDQKNDAPEAVPSSVGIPTSLEKTLHIVRTTMADCDDLQVRELRLGEQGIKIAVVSVDGVTDRARIDASILQPIATDSREAPAAYVNPQETFERIHSLTLSISQVQIETDLREMIVALLRGQCAIIVDKLTQAIMADVASFPGRAATEPSSESIVRGPRESFVELQSVNIALVRKHLRTPDLKLQRFELGRRSKSTIAVMHLAGVANPELVQEVCRRLTRIDIDAVFDGGFVEQLIEDNWLSIFPQIDSTERPDVVVGALLEGRVAIFTGNTPLVLVVPTTLDSLMHSPEDYYQRWQVASSVRLLRFIATLLSLTLPSLYISLTSYHAEMIPTPLALAIGASRQAVPFPAFLEAFLMESALELLREAGIRLPSPIGQTIGIVGGLVIGEAAVRANLVSPTMVIVVALTAISSFAIPHYSAALAFRLARFFLMLLSSLLGLYGMMIGLMVLLSHLCALKSFGVPFLSPWAPLDFIDLKDTLLRLPFFLFRRRPSFVQPVDQWRLDDTPVSHSDPEGGAS